MCKFFQGELSGKGVFGEHVHTPQHSQQCDAACPSTHFEVAICANLILHVHRVYMHIHVFCPGPVCVGFSNISFVLC